MIVNQDCPCNAQLALAFVSSFPEWFIGEEVLDGLMELVPSEFKPFFQKMEKCQELIHNERFRCYGEVSADGSHVMVLVTEFKHFITETEFWRKVEQVRIATNAHLWVIEESRNTDQNWRLQPDGTTKYEEGFAANHGRMERQVELSWRIEKLSYQQITELAGSMAAATQELWEASGICVS